MLFTLLTSVCLSLGQNDDVLFRHQGEFKGEPSVSKFKMEAGKVYRIDAKSKAFDTLLTVKDGTGKRIAFDDDGGGGLNSRVILAPEKSDEYSFEVTAFNKKNGEYELTVREGSKRELVLAEAGKIRSVPVKDRLRIMNDIKKAASEAGENLGQQEINAFINVAMTMEGPEGAEAAKILRDYGQLASKASGPNSDKIGKMLDGVARRVDSFGNTLDIQGVTMDGETFDWKKFRGKVVLVDFWATWCGPCIGEIPNMKKMHEAYNKRGFEIVAISVDQKNQKEKVTKFNETRKLPWVCLFDAEMPDGKSPLAEHYGVMAIPLAILVDRDGKVVSFQARGAELERLLERTIGKE